MTDIKFTTENHFGSGTIHAMKNGTVGIGRATVGHIGIGAAEDYIKNGRDISIVMEDFGDTWITFRVG